MGNFLERARSFLSQLTYGRYGSDLFSLFLVIASLILWILEAIIKISFLKVILWVVSYACLIFAIYRMWSRNYTRRRQENEKFLSIVTPALQGLRRKRAQLRDKDHAYFRCPSCGQLLRVPKGNRTISVTCRNCGNVFQKKT